MIFESPSDELSVQRTKHAESLEAEARKAIEIAKTSKEIGACIILLQKVDKAWQEAGNPEKAKAMNALAYDLDQKYKAVTRRFFFGIKNR